MLNLLPAEVYDIFLLGERSSPGTGALEQTMAALLNATTRDFEPPVITNATVVPTSPSTPADGANLLSFNVTVQLSKPSTLFYGTYRSCHSCSGSPTPAEVVGNQPPATCTANDPSGQCVVECNPVAPLAGQINYVSDTGLTGSVVLNVSGNLIAPTQARSAARAARLGSAWCLSAPPEGGSILGAFPGA